MTAVPHRTFRSLIPAAAVAAALFGLAPAASAEPTHYPLTIRNCGVDVTFAKAPQRAVSIGQSSTEILLSLGLADRIVGTAVWFGPVLKGYEAANDKIKRLADNDPSFESVVGQEPDLVTAQYEWHVGPNGSVGTREQFAELGIPTYVAPADCVEKDNGGGGDGVRKQLFSMDLVYREVHDLAAIFDVGDRGDALVARLKQREAAAIAEVAGVKGSNVPVVFWFSSKEVQGDAFMAGKNGVPAYIMQTLGARNIIKTEEEWPSVSWEQVAASDPAIIVIAEMSRRRYAADDPAVKLNFLATDPVVSKLPAVRDRHFVLIDVQAMEASIRAVDGIEALANGIKAFGLAK
ncbi:iron complex transport system substrate-binding protein [Inquilinus ginsengisoli]|uniref:Iron complex transport system substrate-binding protein n=1 Tax=Inquilinus ginsengisoli TaxID=363840 RepID=A0ABU1JZ32_9PROT|nr:ABC transporter substrate-binding protein [Inquilinus ginsengisoli]MDR6293874.1 iron complex transport system substrate-binding protein [Inquilinus ginsengisoli]